MKPLKSTTLRSLARPRDTKSCGLRKATSVVGFPDGSGFEITSSSPNNIWELALSGEGESSIQEANDFGDPVKAIPCPWQP